MTKKRPTKAAPAATRPVEPAGPSPLTAETSADVAGLLADSRAAHQRYRTAADQRQPALDQIRVALTARQAADALDPDHRHPAWSADVAPHEALVAFYERKLARSA